MSPSRPARLLASALAAATVLGSLALPTVATAATPALDVDALVAKALDVPVVADDGLARAIVAFEDGAVTDGVLSSLDRLGVARGLELQSIDAVAVTALPTVLADVARIPGVVAVEPQRRIQLDLFASRTMIDAEGMGAAESYEREVRDTAVDVAHDGLTGEGVTVAVLDSGIFAEHPDFAGRVDRGLHYSFSEIQDSGGIAYEDWDTYAESTGAFALQDEIGHGTHVASTVGGTGALSADMGGPDLQGVAPGVHFVSMKVATAPFGIVEDIDWEEAALAAFDYSIRHKDELGIKITQNSWGLLPAEPDCLGLHCGEPTDFDGMARMVESVNAAGISVVFSAGNSGPDFDTISVFNDAGNAVAVGAACKSAADGGTRCEDGEVVTGFSSRGAEDGTGAQVDVIAPGDTIMAAASPDGILLPLTECPEATAASPGYFCISGTSMASPHVSGVAAMMYEANMDLTPAEVEACLRDTADDVLEPGFDIASGFGMANARSAVACAVGEATGAFGGELVGEVVFEEVGPGDGFEEEQQTVAEVVRLEGGDRFATAAAVALDRFDPADVDTVYLAVGTDYPDALTGGVLAGVEDAPILLTRTDELPEVTADALAELDPDRVVALGGTAVVSNTTLTAAGAAASATTDRIAGGDRFGTAAAIAGNLPASTVVYLAVGTNYPDALAAGPVTGGAPILLVRTDELTAPTEQVLRELAPERVVALGGSLAVDDEVLARAGEVSGGTTARVEGADRYATATAVADLAGDVDVVYVAVGTDFPDAIAAAPAAVGEGAALVLTAADALPDTTARFLEDSGATRVVILGGEQAVSDGVEAAIRELMLD